MKAKTKPLRVGMVGQTAFSATLSVENNIAFSGTASPEASFDGYVSHPMEFSGVANSQPVSTLFATDGVFSSLSEAFWGTIWQSGQGVETCPLIFNYHHSQTPVKYERLDDLTLAYSGGQLTGVTKESGDALTLEYSGDQLVRVTNSYTGTVKDFTYSGSDLVGVTVSKLV